MEEQLYDNRNIITLTKDGKRLFGNKVMNNHEFIKALASLDRNTTVVVHTDTNIHLPTFVATIDIVKGLGFSNLSLSTAQPV